MKISHPLYLLTMISLIEKTLTMPLASKLLLIASLGSLLFAFIMQFGFNLQPCVLCLWQRLPYGLTAIFSLIAWLWKPFGRQTLLCLILCVVCFLIGMGLGVFHTGVELHWWTGTSGCAVTPLAGASADDIRESLLRTVTPRCDQVAWTLFGLSMANLNIVWSLLLAFFAAAAAEKNLH